MDTTRQHAASARILLGLLALALVASLIGPSSAAQAQEPIVRDHRAPRARVLLVIKRIIVHDDLDWGNGEISISYTVRTHGQYCVQECGETVVEGQLPQFTATNGWVQQTDRLVPSAADATTDSAVSPELGIPLRANRWYGVEIRGVERDPTVDDQLGVLHADITDPAGQIRFGTHTEQARRFSFSDGELPAAFSVEYEVRRAPLPDLRPVNITVTDLPNSVSKRVCTTVQNIEAGQASAFLVALYVDGAAASGGQPVQPLLAPGQHVELCQETQLPTSGQHQLRAVVDEPQRVVEFSETNNVYEEAY